MQDETSDDKAWSGRFSEPVDEIILDVPPHHVSSWLHQDLAHRLAHFGIPVVTIRHDAADHVARS